jgi:hypothetical protein
LHDATIALKLSSLTSATNRDEQRNGDGGRDKDQLRDADLCAAHRHGLDVEYRERASADARTLNRHTGANAVPVGRLNFCAALSLSHLELAGIVRDRYGDVVFCSPLAIAQRRSTPRVKVLGFCTSRSILIRLRSQLTN